MKIFSHIDGAVVDVFVDGKNHFFKFKYNVPKEIDDKVADKLLAFAFLEKARD